MIPDDGYATTRLRIGNWTSTLNDPAQRMALTSELQALLTPAVLRHLPEPLHLSEAPAAIDRWIAARQQEGATMTVRDKADGGLLGLLILAEAAESTHLGYLFAESAWGKGCATELIAGLIHFYRHQPHPRHLLAGVAKSNPASAKALQKNGFKKAPDLSSDENDMFRLHVAR